MTTLAKMRLFDRQIGLFDGVGITETGIYWNTNTKWFECWMEEDAVEITKLNLVGFTDYDLGPEGIDLLQQDFDRWYDDAFTPSELKAYMNIVDH